LKAFTMVEVAYLAQRAKTSARDVLERLRDAGWIHCRAAARRSSAIAAASYATKDHGEQWIETARTAHAWGCARIARCSTGTSRTRRTGRTIW